MEQEFKSGYTWLSDNPESRALHWLPQVNPNAYNSLKFGVKPPGIPVYSKELAIFFDGPSAKVLKKKKDGKEIILLHFVVNYVLGYDEGIKEFNKNHSKSREIIYSPLFERYKCEIKQLYDSHDFGVPGYLGAKKILECEIKTCPPQLFHKLGFIAAYYHEIELLFSKFPELKTFVLSSNKSDEKNKETNPGNDSMFHNLSLKEIALICYYIDIHVDKESANEILSNTKYSSTTNLVRHYNNYRDGLNRIVPPEEGKKSRNRHEQILKNVIQRLSELNKNTEAHKAQEDLKEFHKRN